jgi:hypothetical protein
MNVSEARIADVGRAVNAEMIAVVLPLFATGLGLIGLVLANGEMNGIAHHLLMIIGMTLAMMSAFAIPVCRAVARGTLWWHANAAVVVALLSFLSVWILAAAVLHLGVGALGTLIGPVAIAAVITICCASSQIGRPRARRLAACQLTRPLRPGQHVRAAAQWAGLAGARCVRVCALPMALTAAQPTLAILASVTALLWIERVAHRPPLRLWLAVGYLGTGALVVITTNSGLMPAAGHHSSR